MSDYESGFDRVAGAVMASEGKTVNPLERAVIVGLFPKLAVADQRFLLAYYKQCRRNYRLTRATSRRVIAVQIVVKASD